MDGEKTIMQAMQNPTAITVWHPSVALNYAI